MNNQTGKLQKAVIGLSKDILSREIENNLDTIVNYSENLELSLGTIQKALKELTDIKAIDLRKKGKYGTVIENIDYKKLLEILKINYLLCVMPITYSQRYKKIMDNIANSLKIPISLYFSHMRGGYVRQKLIEEGVYHFGVVSKLAAQNAIDSGFNLEIIEEFGPRTYVTKHVILKRKDCKVINVGKDSESNDHIFLTNFNFQKNENIKIVDIKYSEVIENLIAKKIDAAIWNYDDVLDKMIHLEKHGIVIEELNENEGNLLATESVIVIRKGNEVIKNIFKKFFDKEKFKLID
ncbi:YhfZ family protein [Fusobacterium sp.]|uniref:YhfZ family protein n=1 Tax=Fusobacterium sp. TaxID=68766 RepID=UPI0029051090|nr:YhfZ family protein [Fusobacterium sp.]MDU1912436.1 YhfZ family protein [Fusobacterium sp.]